MFGNEDSARSKICSRSWYVPTFVHMKFVQFAQRTKHGKSKTIQPSSLEKREAKTIFSCLLSNSPGLLSVRKEARTFSESAVDQSAQHTMRRTKSQRKLTSSFVWFSTRKMQRNASSWSKQNGLVLKVFKVRSRRTGVIWMIGACGGGSSGVACFLRSVASDVNCMTAEPSRCSLRSCQYISSGFALWCEFVFYTCIFQFSAFTYSRLNFRSIGASLSFYFGPDCFTNHSECVSVEKKTHWNVIFVLFAFVYTRKTKTNAILCGSLDKPRIPKKKKTRKN